MKRIAFFLSKLFLFASISLCQGNNEYGVWILADTMNKVTEGVSTLLNNGKVLVAGNNSACELYNYKTNTWQPTDSMSYRRTGHALIGLHDGRALVMGGKDILKNEIYDDTEGKWETCAFFNIDPRYDGKAILLEDGKVLYTGGIINGKTTASCELYDPVIDEWEVVDSLAFDRVEHGINLLQDGSVLVSGGASSIHGNLNTCELFDPNSKQWTEVSPMNEKHTNHASVNLTDGRVMVLGGEYNMNSAHCEVYNPVINKWIQVDNIEPGCNLNNGGAFIISDSKILIIDRSVWGIYDTESFISLGFFYTKNYSLSQRPMHEILPDGNVISMGGWVFTIDGHYGPNRLCEIFRPIITGVSGEETEDINKYQVFNNYPNPFNPSTIIRYSLAVPSIISLEIYNILGQKVIKLIDNDYKPSGINEIIFESDGLPSGIYYYRLSTPHFTKIKKMLKLN